MSDDFPACAICLYRAGFGIKRAARRFGIGHLRVKRMAQRLGVYESGRLNFYREAKKHETAEKLARKPKRVPTVPLTMRNGRRRRGLIIRRTRRNGLRGSRARAKQQWEKNKNNPEFRRKSSGLDFFHSFCCLAHIDHIIPCASFKLLHCSIAEQRQCFHYTNLRPLWGEENIAKGAKVITHQPELALPIGTVDPASTDATTSVHVSLYHPANEDSLSLHPTTGIATAELFFRMKKENTKNPQ